MRYLFALVFLCSLSASAQDRCVAYFDLRGSQPGIPAFIKIGPSTNQAKWLKENLAKHSLCQDTAKAKYLLVWSPATTNTVVSGNSPVYSTGTISGPNGTSTVTTETNVPYAFPSTAPGARILVFKSTTDSLLSDYGQGIPPTLVYQSAHFRTGASYAGFQLTGSRKPDLDVLKDAIQFIEKDHQ
jgi:hypothetical protein